MLTTIKGSLVLVRFKPQINCCKWFKDRALQQVIFGERNLLKGIVIFKKRCHRYNEVVPMITLSNLSS